MSYITKHDPTGRPYPVYLVQASLKELIESDRVKSVFSGQRKAKCLYRKDEKKLSRLINGVTFHVSTETNKQKPLKILVEDSVIYPSSPVLRIETSLEVGFYYDDLVLPGNLHFRNKKCWLFDEAESGWEELTSVNFSKALTERIWNEKGYHIRTTVKYETK